MAYATRDVERRIRDGYTQSWSIISAQLDELTELIQSSPDAKRSWLVRQARLQSTLDLIESQVDLLSADARTAVMLERRNAIDAATREFLDRLPAEITVPGRPSPEAFERLVAGGNLERLFSSLGPSVLKEARDKLTVGLLAGKSPRLVARDLRNVLGGNMARAQTIARTEILRAYRDAAQLNYHSNRDVVQGWVWHAALDSRTCAMCWSLHGQEFSTEDKQATHPGCRCTMIPKTERGPNITGGEERFRRLTETEQRQILGPGRFKLWQDGEVAFTKLATPAFRTRYGPARRLKTVRELTHA